VIDTEFLRQLFPRTEEIPLEHRPPAAIHQRRVLINGELRSWQGSCQTVVSPVRFRNTAEVLEQVELGSYPEGSESDADDALAAALLAYDNGRGAWPTMSVAERIDCMHAMIINPKDALARNIGEGSAVRIFNDRGSFEAIAKVSADVMQGIVVAPLGYWRDSSRGKGPVNALSPGVYADLGRAPTFGCVGRSSGRRGSGRG
jgi:hypothetical protein